jgi:hypothetical protein
LFVCLGWFLSLEMDWPLSQSMGGVGFAIMLASRLLAVVTGR